MNDSEIDRLAEVEDEVVMDSHTGGESNDSQEI